MNSYEEWRAKQPNFVLPEDDYRKMYDLGMEFEHDGEVYSLFGVEMIPCR